MMKRLPLLLLWFLPGCVFAQQIVITGTVKDPNGVAYQNGRGRAILSPTNVFFTTGLTNPVPGSQSPVIIDGLDGFGHFSVSLTSTAAIDQQSSNPQWLFTFCSAAYPVQGPICFSVPPLTLTSSQDITAIISAVPPPVLPGAGGGAGANPAPPNNVVQKNSTGTFAASSAVDDAAGYHFKGPNPNTDITQFGARTCNQNAAPCTSGVTASINSGSTSVTISTSSCPGQANSVCFVNGDGIVIYGAGAAQSLATPGAPTVTNVLATDGTGTGYTNTGAAGSSTRCYKIIARDTGGGFTAASPETCNTTSQSTLGVVTVNLTSCSRSTTTVTCTTASATPLLVGGGGPIGEVYIGGAPGTIDNSFRGFREVQSVPDSTHFIYTDSAVNTALGAPASTTGGTATFYAANHLSWTAVTGAWLYYIYEGASGAETLIGVSRPNAVSLNTTFDDFGSGLMSNYTFPAFIPTTPPTSPANDNLSTTILSGSGTTTLTLLNAAGTSVSGATVRLDAGVGIAKAATASSTISPLYIPNDPSGNPFVVNNFCDVRNSQVAIYQSGLLWLNETFAIGPTTPPAGTVRWTASQNIAFGSNGGGSGFGPSPSVQIKEASPGVFVGGGNQIFVDGPQFIYRGTNGSLLFFSDGGGFNDVFQNTNFVTGTTASDVMGFGLTLNGTSGVYFNNVGFNAGSSADGTSHNAPFFCNLCGDVHMHSIYTLHRGFILVAGGPGGALEMDSNHYNGGGTPLVSIRGPMNVIFGPTVVIDTIGHPCVAMLSGAKGFVTARGCAPSGYTFASPAVTGTVQYVGGGAGPASLTDSLLTNQVNSSGGRESDGTPVVDQQFSGPGAVTVGATDSVIVNNAVPATPTCSVSAGGSIAVGTYTFVVQPVWQNSQEGVPSFQSAGCTTTPGNQTITVNWTTVAGNPTLYRIFATGVSSGLQANVTPPTTSVVLTTIGVGTNLNTVPLGGPTMLMSGTQGIAAPAYVTTSSSTFGSTASAASLTANRTVTWPDASGDVFVVPSGTPTCSATGTGTGATCGTFQTNSDDVSGAFTISTGTTPAATGTITLTFSNSGGGIKYCVFVPANTGLASWNARASFIPTAAGGSNDQAAWDNNAVNLTGSTTYVVQYLCGRH